LLYARVLQGMANEFYRQRVSEHLHIGLEAVRLLREQVRPTWCGSRPCLERQHDPPNVRHAAKLWWIKSELNGRFFE
jgi:hypothetical protein